MSSSIETDVESITSQQQQQHERIAASREDTASMRRQRREEELNSIDPWSIVAKYPEVSARWKSSIIAGILRLLFIPGFSILLAHYMSIIDVHKLQSGLEGINSSNAMFTPFMVNIFVSLGGYVLAWAACIMCLRIAAFALPLTLATPVALLYVMFSCGFSGCNVAHGHNLTYTLPAALCLYVAQLLSTSYFIYKTQTLIMQKESQVKNCLNHIIS